MRKQWIADAVLLGVAAVWGTTFVLVQNAVQVLPPFSFLAVRFGIAALLLLPFLKTVPRARGSDGNLYRAGISLGFWLFAGYAFQTVGLLYTTSSKAGFITGLSVVLVPVFTFLILKIRPKLPAVTGVILAAIGLYFLTLGESLTVNTGDLLVFFCAVGFALQIVFTGKYASRHPALPLTIVQLGAVSLFSLAFALLFEDLKLVIQPEVMFNPWVLAALFITSFFATALAFLAQTRFQQDTTPTRVALIFAMEPVFAALTGVFWAGETLTYKQLAGCALIFFGMVLAELPVETFRKLFRNPFLKVQFGKERVSKE